MFYEGKEVITDKAEVGKGEFIFREDIRGNRRWRGLK